MAEVKSGFFNSRNQDRMYDATDFGRIFDGIINDGVYGTIGNKFAVTASGGLTVNVGTGRAWFNHIWVLNEGMLTLEIRGNATIQPRIDAVIFEINTREQVRATEITIVEGEPSTSPVKPAIISENGIYRYPIAYITVRANTPSIDSADIEYVVGTSECPIITAPLEVSSFDNWLRQWSAEFNNWYSHLRDELDENQAGHLQNQIDDLKETVDILPGEWTEITLLASGWSETGEYSLESLYPSSVYDITSVLPNANTTPAMRQAWHIANCVGYNTTNVIKAHATKPSIDITLGISVVRRS